MPMKTAKKISEEAGFTDISTLAEFGDHDGELGEIERLVPKIKPMQMTPRGYGSSSTPRNYSGSYNTPYSSSSSRYQRTPTGEDFSTELAPVTKRSNDEPTKNSSYRQRGNLGSGVATGTHLPSGFKGRRSSRNNSRNYQQLGGFSYSGGRDPFKSSALSDDDAYVDDDVDIF